MTNYRMTENSEWLEKTETVERKSQVSVQDLKLQCQQLDNEIERLIKQRQSIIDELTAIQTSGIVEVKEIPSPIQVTEK